MSMSSTQEHSDIPQLQQQAYAAVDHLQKLTEQHASEKEVDAQLEQVYQRFSVLYGTLLHGAQNEQEKRAIESQYIEHLGAITRIVYPE